MSASLFGLVDAPKIQAVYDLEERVVGEGGFGAVYQCCHRRTGALCAVKVVKLNAIHSQHLRDIHQEIFALRHLNHPNIIRAEEVFFGSSVAYIVMEYCEVCTSFYGVYRRLIIFVGRITWILFAKAERPTSTGGVSG